LFSCSSVATAVSPPRQVRHAVHHPSGAACNFPTLRSCLQFPHPSGVACNFPTLKSCLQFPHPSDDACCFPAPQLLLQFPHPSGEACSAPACNSSPRAVAACNCPTLRSCLQFFTLMQLLHAISPPSGPACNLPTSQVMHAIFPPSGPACNLPTSQVLHAIPHPQVLPAISPPLRCCM
jgi:hypothetical protein